MFKILSKGQNGMPICKWMSTETGYIIDSRRNEYYKKLVKSAKAEFDTDKKPEGWKKALPFEDIPGPKPLPVLGNFWRFIPLFGEYANTSAHIVIERLHEKYGNIVVLKGIGRPTSVLLKVPEDFEKVFCHEGPHPIRKSLAPYTYYRNVERKELFKGCPGVATTYGEEWFNIRSTINPILMKPRVVAEKVPEVDQVVQDFIRNINYFIKKHKYGIMPDNFMVEVEKWTIESMGVLSLDTRFGCLDLDASGNCLGIETMETVKEILELLYKLDVKPSLWRHVSTPNWRRFVKLFDKLTSNHLKHVDEAMVRIQCGNKPENRQSALERLSKVNREVALVTSVDMLLGGVDTTSNTVASALYLLAKNPEVQEKLYKECFNNLPHKDSSLTTALLDKSPYLKTVVKETLRIYPAGSSTLRTSETDMVLSGYQIPKGTEIYLDTRHSCHNEKYFKKPWEFIPERWLRANNGELSHKNAHPFAYLPFGHGPRTCIGKRMALMQVEVAVAKIVRNFRISWPHKEEPQFEQKIFFGISSPLKLQFKSREQ